MRGECFLAFLYDQFWRTVRRSNSCWGPWDFTIGTMTCILINPDDGTAGQRGPFPETYSTNTEERNLSTFLQRSFERFLRFSSYSLLTSSLFWLLYANERGHCWTFRIDFSLGIPGLLFLKWFRGHRWSRIDFSKVRGTLRLNGKTNTWTKEVRVIKLIEFASLIEFSGRAKRVLPFCISFFFQEGSFWLPDCRWPFPWRITVH